MMPIPARLRAFALLASLMISSLATAQTLERAAPAESTNVSQAHRALLASADYLVVAVSANTWQTINRKSLHLSSRALRFDGVPADQYNGGQHHYQIEFARVAGTSVKCERSNCILSVEGSGVLLRNEAGAPSNQLRFQDPILVDGNKPSTCSATCRRVVADFAAALGSLRESAIARNGDKDKFHEQAAAWRALTTKPALPEGVREQRLLAEDALKEKRLGDALDFYEAGLDLCPTWPEGWFNAALITAELGSYADAAELMQNYLELVPDAQDAQVARDQIVIWRHKAK